jgi:hypothetical protein
MTQRRWGDPDSPAAYRDEQDPYADLYRAPRREQSRVREEPRRRDASPRWGNFPGRLGVCVVIGSAALGGLVTAVTGQQPGAVLGAFLVIGTLVAALAVRPRTGYLIIPVPALSYLVAAMIAGLIYDRSNDGSKAALAINASQWIAGGFVAMAAATLLAIVIAAARWRRKSRLWGDD